MNDIRCACCDAAVSQPSGMLLCPGCKTLLCPDCYSRYEGRCHTCYESELMEMLIPME